MRITLHNSEYYVITVCYQCVDTLTYRHSMLRYNYSQVQQLQVGVVVQCNHQIMVLMVLLLVELELQAHHQLVVPIIQRHSEYK
jgi:hypothetical protein